MRIQRTILTLMGTKGSTSSSSSSSLARTTGILTKDDVTPKTPLKNSKTLEEGEELQHEDLKGIRELKITYIVNAATMRTNQCIFKAQLHRQLNEEFKLL